MPRRIATRTLLLLLAVLPWPAGAREVRTGNTAYVRRAGTGPEEVTLLWATPEQTGAVELVGLTGWIKKGGRYYVADEQGLLGSLYIDDVVQDKSCTNLVYERANARITPTPSRQPYGSSLAIGPSEVVGSRAKVLPYLNGTQAPPGTQGALGVDLDGDGEADLAREIYSCDPHSRQRNYGQVSCVDIWMRSDGKWRLVKKGDYPPCY